MNDKLLGIQHIPTMLVPVKKIIENYEESLKQDISKKVDKIDGKALSTNDYTTEEKNKLAGIEDEANKTIVDTELSEESTNPVENKAIHQQFGNLTQAFGEEIQRIDVLIGDQSVSQQINNPKKSVAFIDQGNGYTYVVYMYNGNLVSRTSVTSIELTTMPTKTTYATGESFDPTGMIVTATLQDGSVQELTNYTYPLTITKTPVIIEHQEAGKTFTIAIPISYVDLTDFEYTANEDGTYTLTAWKQTLNGEPSTELVVPDNELIII